jgi:hypothetical protein
VDWLRTICCGYLAQLQCNPYVPELLLSLSEPPRFDRKYLTGGDHVGNGIHYATAVHGRDVWRNVPGALEWLREHATDGGGVAKPPWSTLLELLNSELHVLVHVKSRDSYRPFMHSQTGVIATRNNRIFFGCPPVPHDFNDDAGGRICVYRRPSPDEDRDDAQAFFSVFYDNIIAVPFWHIMLRHLVDTSELDMNSSYQDIRAAPTENVAASSDDRVATLVNSLSVTCTEATQLATDVTRAFDSTMRNLEEALGHILPTDFCRLQEMEKIELIITTMGSGQELRSAMTTLRKWRNGAVHQRGNWRQPPSRWQVGQVLETIQVYKFVVLEQ